MAPLSYLLLKPLSDSMGVPPDQLALILGQLLSCLVGYIFYLIKMPVVLRHIFAIVLGLLLILFVYGAAKMIHLFNMPMGVWLIMKFAPRHRVGLFSFLYSMGYLSFIHIYNMYYDFAGWTMDLSTTLMYVVVKLTMLACNYQDGGAEGDRASVLNSYQINMKLTEMPSQLEFWSYILCYSSCVCGPAFEYKHYKEFTERRGDFEDIPSPVLPTLYKLFWTAFSIVVTLFLSNRYPGKACVSKEIAQESSLFYRLFYYNLSMTFYRFRYYSAWELADASIRACGAAYNGKDQNGKPKWNRIESLDLVKIETGYNVRDLKDDWNHTVAEWLKNYVYTRVINHYKRLNKKPFSPILVTSMVSAFWHGFYPTYYIMFSGAYMLTEASRELYRRRESFTFVPWPIMRTLAMIWSFGLLNFLGISFALLHPYDEFRFIKSIYAIPSIIMLSVMYVLPVVWPLKKSKERKD